MVSRSSLESLATGATNSDRLHSRPSCVSKVTLSDLSMEAWLVIVGNRSVTVIQNVFDFG